MGLAVCKLYQEGVAMGKVFATKKGENCNQLS